ncbi:chaperonin 10-like protein [Xylariomycetidae sp. FL2044]|nr:chaperonin 10-like protein [Xylariomycetidae sp. FL2044]
MSNPSIRLPATQTAVLTTADGGHTVAYNQPLPTCGPTSILVRVRAVALNPTDHKTPARVKTAGLVSGCDFAGEVVEVGARANDEPSDASSSSCSLPRRWSPGDRVFGVVYGSNPGQPDWGAFADFVEADPVMLCRAPADWDWETAASVGGSVHGSVALCLFGEGRLGLHMDHLWALAVGHGETNGGAVNGKVIRDSGTAVTELGKGDLKKTVLVYGGSTACGTAALQILRL